MRPNTVPTAPMITPSATKIFMTLGTPAPIDLRTAISRGLLEHQHDERRDDDEARDEHDEAEDHRHHHLLHLQGGEEAAVQLAPVLRRGTASRRARDDHAPSTGCALRHVVPDLELEPGDGVADAEEALRLGEDRGTRTSSRTRTSRCRRSPPPGTGGSSAAGRPARGRRTARRRSPRPRRTRAASGPARGRSRSRAGRGLRGAAPPPARPAAARPATGSSRGAREPSSRPSCMLAGRSVTVPIVATSTPFRIAPVRFWPVESITSL